MRFSISILLGTLLTGTCAALSAFGADGKPFNPDLSVNFLGLAQSGTSYSSDRNQSSRHNGLQLQEAELQFLSDVDPYFRANALLSISQQDGKTDYGIGPEEVFLESISLPYVTIRAGKFKMALGKHNQLHTHAFPFIDPPLISQKLLGDEGLNENAVSGAGLIPLPWYSELTLQAFSLSNTSIYGTYNSGDVGGLAHLKNLWDLNDDTTVELGLSGTAGKNQTNQLGSIIAGDLTFKWRPALGGKYHALIWSTEYLYGQRNGLVDASGNSLRNLGGVASWLQYQFAERWWVQARGEYVGTQRSAAIPVVTKESALIALLPSEFSGLRVQYDYIQDRARSRNDHTVALQYNITIGAHPAHAY
jgi:hypothetical protein